MWSSSQPDLLLVTIDTKLAGCLANLVVSLIQTDRASITINSPAQCLFSSMSAVPKGRGTQQTSHMEDKS